MKVQDVMTSNVKICRLETDLSTVAIMMWDGDCNVMPVVNGTGKIIGMITDRDVAIVTAAKGRRASDISVSEVIRGKVYPCDPDQNIEFALTYFAGSALRPEIIDIFKQSLIGNFDDGDCQ